MTSEQGLNSLISENSLQQMQSQRILEAKLNHLSTQARKFTQLKDRLILEEQDPKTIYQQIRSDSSALLSELKTLRKDQPSREEQKGPRVLPSHHNGFTAFEPDIIGSVLQPHFNLEGDLIMSWEGRVQIPQASEGISITTQTPGSYGEFITTDLREWGGVEYFGTLTDETATNPNDSKVWLRTWKWVIPFPPAPMLSRLTYRFKVAAQCAIHCVSAPLAGSFMSFVSIGEETNLTPGGEVEVNQNAGWPIIVDIPDDLLIPSGGSYGFFQGDVIIEGSFIVSAGNVGALGLVGGAAGILANGSYNVANGLLSPMEVLPSYPTPTPEEQADAAGKVYYRFFPIEEASP